MSTLQIHKNQQWQRAKYDDVGFTNSWLLNCQPHGPTTRPHLNSDICTRRATYYEHGPCVFPCRFSKLQIYQIQYGPNANTNTIRSPNVGSEMTVHMHHQHDHHQIDENCARYNEILKTWSMCFPISVFELAKLSISIWTTRKHEHVRFTEN